jgi:Protein of unknown function (DUF3489)
MSAKLSNAEHEMMSAAARRDHRCLEPPKSLKQGALQKIAANLVAAGLTREIKAKAAPVWRRDEDSGKSIALKLTAAGFNSIVVAGDMPSEQPGIAASDASGAASNCVEPSDATDAVIRATTTAAEPAQSPTITSSTEAAPREGTKIASVLELLQRDEGATLDEVIATTGWLPHTSRAALTGLRKRGYGIERRARPEGDRAYAINVARQA